MNSLEIPNGRVILPDQHDEYDAARRVWNGAIDRRPAMIVQCYTVADVIASVRFARAHDILIAVRGGGHNVAGSGTCDDGMVIDLSPMKGVRVDPVARVATAQAGLLWGELDAQTQAHGLAVPGGIVSTTGIAGFTLGGGIGWLHRAYGFTVDNLLAAEVVTADGEVIRASHDSHPDLLWGLRGGGGNFGIVTAFEFRLHPVGPELMAGLIFFPGDQLPQVVRGYREIMAQAPDALTLFLIMRKAPAAPFLPPSVHGQPVVAVAGCYTGAISDAEAELKPLTTLASPLANLMQPRQYTQFQSMLDGSWAPGFGNYWKAEYLAGIPDTALHVLEAYLRDITSPLSDFKFAALGGAAGRIAPDATAFPARHAPFVLNINSRWSLPGDADPHIAWTQQLWEATRPFSAGGTYVNFMGEEGHDRVRAAYGEATYRRLVCVKDTYDPGNVFRLNQNIQPSAG
jgi:FAD/FMN-containing dehydrogenase